MRYGLPSSGERTMLRDRLESTARSHGLLDSDFYRKAVDKFNSIDFERIERKIEAVRRKVTHIFDHDAIRNMSSIGDFQQAGPVQARWIMANPRAKKLFEKDMLHGYRDMFTNRYPGRYGDDDPDYQQVMNGLAQFDEAGNAKFVEYLHLYDEDGRTELSFANQVRVRDSMWANFDAFLDEGLDDPSSEDNNSL
ncbi:hypothetical protein D3C86_1063670 [compost metagenome]